MASTTLCDYQVLSDKSFTLDVRTNEREKHLDFNVPLDFHFGTGARKPILAFKVAPFEDSIIKFKLNERDIASFDLDKSHVRGLWEAFSATTAFPDKSCLNKSTELRVVITLGKARLEDVVIWYQINR